MTRNPLVDSICIFIYNIIIYRDNIYIYIIYTCIYRKYTVQLFQETPCWGGKILGAETTNQMELFEHVVPLMKSRALLANLGHPKQGQQGEGADIIQPDFNGLGVP